MVKQSCSIGALCFALVASAGQARAQNAVTTLNLQVSTDGINWTNGLDLQSSSATRRVLFRASVSWSSDTLPAPLGFASLTMQPIFVGFRVADAIAPFANIGNNLNGGSITLDSTPMDGPFGRPSPFAAAGTLNVPYVVHVHNGLGGPPGERYLRIARQDVTRWIGTGPNRGTEAANNFNGRGGLVHVQKPISLLNPNDAPFHFGTQNIVLLQLAIDIAPTAVGELLDLSINVPPLAMPRDSETYNRPVASWYGNDSGFQTLTLVNVISASIHIPSPPLFTVAGFSMLAMTRRSRPRGRPAPVETPG